MSVKLFVDPLDGPGVAPGSDDDENTEADIEQRQYPVYIYLNKTQKVLLPYYQIGNKAPDSEHNVVNDNTDSYLRVFSLGEQQNVRADIVTAIYNCNSCDFKNPLYAYNPLILFIFSLK